VRRHLSVPEAAAALRRGSQIEQFLGFGEEVEGRSTLSYVWLSGRSKLSGRLERRFDDGSPTFFDVGEFQTIDDDGDAEWDPFAGPPPDDGYREFDSVEAALAWARTECGADDVRWVNSGLIDAEYRDAKGW